MINYLRNVDEEESHELLNFRSLAWFTAQAELSVCQKKTITTMFV